MEGKDIGKRPVNFYCTTDFKRVIPSTSPAKAIRFKDKLDQWKVVLSYLGLIDKYGLNEENILKQLHSMNIEKGAEDFVIYIL
ncbi:hypothetical protein [Thermoanaerobacterium butyriciformans]|uniref:Uncharacterized protein n=1 Tax=Thermoanaerobacterium butyriciformans TaxID=1702242 RepID=A0ABS4NFU6_9THEO|nr:hypothetical protein [Thermoanaerobacterium butyriciformans]MBP2072537.1 hypothetical protein [Thermoanaerobacterium butyriciformans]